MRLVIFGLYGTLLSSSRSAALQINFFGNNIPGKDINHFEALKNFVADNQHNTTFAIATTSAERVRAEAILQALGVTNGLVQAFNVRSAKDIPFELTALPSEYQEKLRTAWTDLRDMPYAQGKNIHIANLIMMCNQTNPSNPVTEVVVVDGEQTNFQAFINFKELAVELGEAAALFDEVVRRLVLVDEREFMNRLQEASDFAQPRDNLTCFDDLDRSDDGLCDATMEPLEVDDGTHERLTYDKNEEPRNCCLCRIS